MEISFIRKRAFTLIELLTVIAIIGVLAALLFPAIKSAMLKAETNKAHAAIASSLATAFRAYYTEYGKWPVVYPGTGPYAYEDFIVDEKIIALLTGDDVGGAGPKYLAPGPYYPRIDTTFGPPYTTFSAAEIQGNPRKIVFLEVKNKDLDPSTGYFVDTWGKPYHFRLDVNYQNQVIYPFDAAQATPVTGTGFLIWSVGHDGQYDRTDTILQPSPLVVKSSEKNKDNIISW